MRLASQTCTLKPFRQDTRANKTFNVKSQVKCECLRCRNWRIERYCWKILRGEDQNKILIFFFFICITDQYDYQLTPLPYIGFNLDRHADLTSKKKSIKSKTHLWSMNAIGTRLIFDVVTITIHKWKLICRNRLMQ